MGNFQKIKSTKDTKKNVKREKFSIWSIVVWGLIYLAPHLWKWIHWSIHLWRKLIKGWQFEIKADRSVEITKNPTGKVRNRREYISLLLELKEKNHYIFCTHLPMSHRPHQ